MGLMTRIQHCLPQDPPSPSENPTSPSENPTRHRRGCTVFSVNRSWSRSLLHRNPPDITEEPSPPITDNNRPPPPLPDDIVYDILLRLPSKDIGRCRCACKRFSSLTSDPSFIRSHARRAAPALIIQGTRLSTTVEHTDLFVIDKIGAGDDGTGCRVTPIKIKNPKNQMISLHSSCNGLLCFTAESGCYIYNPVIRDWIDVPIPQHLRLQAFYIHPSTGEYRLLLRSIVVKEGVYAYEVFDIGTGKFRPIGSSPYAPNHLSHAFPIRLLDSLHWISEAHLDDASPCVVAFNVESEEFRMITLPRGCGTDGRKYLIETDGCLGLCQAVTAREMEIWVLTNYNRSIWLRRHTVWLPRSIRGPAAGALAGQVKHLSHPIGEGELLMELGDNSTHRGRHQYGLVVCNYKLKTSRRLMISSLFPWRNFVMWLDAPYMETLVSLQGFGGLRKQGSGKA